jgi:hypothetical protein
MRNLSELILPRAEASSKQFRLAFNSVSPIQEVVLSERGLFGHILIRGEDYCGRTKAVSEMCGDAAMAGIGVIYVTDGMLSPLAATLKAKAQISFGTGRYHALNIDAELGRKFKVSRHGVSVLQFNSTVAPSSPGKIRRRMPGIIDWIMNSDIDSPLLLALENYHLYFNDFVVDTLDRAESVNCAVLLTTMGSDPRGTSPEIHPRVFEKCGTILDLNRRRAKASY